MNFKVRRWICFILLGAMMASFATAQAAHKKDEGAKTTVITQPDKTIAAAPKPAPGLNTMKQWNVQSAETGGTLLFSDSPEIVQQDGILYSDTVEGKARILYYHLNATKEDKKIAVVLENLSSTETTVSVTRGGLSTPSENYLDVGKATQTEYFFAPKRNQVYIEAYGKRLLDPRMGTTVVAPDKLVYGVFDFTTTTPVKVTVVALPATANPVDFVARANVLPADSHRLRGTFAGMDRFITSEQVYDPEKDGAIYFSLADDSQDLYRIGVDATDGSIVKNYGNYGILYTIHIPTRGVGKTRYYLKPSGGSYAGVMTARFGTNGNENMIPTPSDKVFFGEDPKRIDLADLGTYNNINSLWFKFSPPGASNLPVRIILIPAK